MLCLQRPWTQREGVSDNGRTVELIFASLYKWEDGTEDGRGDRIRTCDPLVPNQMRYQTALLPDRRRAARIVWLGKICQIMQLTQPFIVECSEAP
jgi:hypothetical protein